MQQDERREAVNAVMEEPEYNIAITSEHSSVTPFHPPTSEAVLARDSSEVLEISTEPRTLRRSQRPMSKKRPDYRAIGGRLRPTPLYNCTAFPEREAPLSINRSPSDLQQVTETALV